MPSWLKIITAILGEAEQIVPIFIHNPKSQQFEGIIVTTLNSTLNSALGGLANVGTPAATTTTTTTTKS
jgi:hypothetical protein